MSDLSRARRETIALALIALAGCSSMGQPAPDLARPGPVLVAAVVNRTDAQVVFSYEFEAVDRSSTGSGEGVVTPCTAMTESWSEVTGAYALMLDGEVIHEGRLLPGQGDDAYLVVRIELHRGERPAVVPPVLNAAAPELGSRELGGCD